MSVSVEQLSQLPRAEKEEALALLVEKRRRERRRQARTDLYFLLTDVLRRRDAIHPWIQARCEEVQAAPNGYLDLWAREHFKSSILTFGKLIQDILASHGENPLPEWSGREATIGIFSHTRPIAKGFLRQIKLELETNAELKRLFPDVLYSDPKRDSPKWSEDDGIVVKRRGSNPKEATIEAWGIVDGQPTGKHFLVLHYDDLVTLASVTTPEMIQKTTQALEMSFNLGIAGGVRRFVGTRYHFSDSYGALIDRAIAIPRIHPATVDGRVEGEPVLLTREQIAQKRRDQGPYVFSCQQLLNPVADEAQGFKREWIRYYDFLDTGTLTKYILRDPASSKKKSGDYTCDWVIGLGRDQNYYVIDLERDRLNLTQRTKSLMDKHRRHKPIETRYESYGMQADIEHIQYVQEKETYRFDITEVGGSTPKPDRIRRLIPLFEQGRVYFPRSLHKTLSDGTTFDMVETFTNHEYLAFPVSIHDDMLDALARIAEPDLPLTWPKQEDAGMLLNFESQFSSAGPDRGLHANW